MIFLFLRLSWGVIHCVQYACTHSSWDRQIDVVNSCMYHFHTFKQLIQGDPDTLYSYKWELYTVWTVNVILENLYLFIILVNIQYILPFYSTKQQKGIGFPKEYRFAKTSLTVHTVCLKIRFQFFIRNMKINARYFKMT